MKRIIYLFALFSALQMPMSVSAQSENNTDPDRKLEFSAIAELGFLTVMDHKIQFSQDGTYFDYRRDGGQDVLFPVSRLSLEMKSDRSTFYLLYQPLRLQSEVYLENDLVVDTAVFSAGSGVRLLYNFPFFRFSYTRELFPNSKKFSFAMGASIQLRNATISFESMDGEIFRTNRDVGIVPALKFKTHYQFTDKFRIASEVDGMYAPISYLNGSDNEVVGAILDASLRANYRLMDPVEGFLNLRYLGGGAVGTSDNVDGPGDGYVRNWLHFGTVTAGCRYTF